MGSLLGKTKQNNLMANSLIGDIAPDFLSRELARKYEFSEVWRNELDAVFTDVAPYYDFASNLASIGMFGRWRQRFISTIRIKLGDTVLDVCAGTNGVGIKLLQRQPDVRVFAIDRNKAMQEVGRDLARAQGLQIESIIGDVHQLPFPDDSFDVVTLQWASRHLRIVEVFSEIKRVLKPRGYFYHCDMLRPERKLIEALYSAYLRACVSMTGLVFRSSPEAWSCRDYLVRAVQLFYSSEELTKLLISVGFSNISSKTAMGGIVACHKALKA